MWDVSAMYESIVASISTTLYWIELEMAEVQHTCINQALNTVVTLVSRHPWDTKSKASV